MPPPENRDSADLKIPAINEYGDHDAAEIRPSGICATYRARVSVDTSRRKSVVVGNSYFSPENGEPTEPTDSRFWKQHQNRKRKSKIKNHNAKRVRN